MFRFCILMILFAGFLGGCAHSVHIYHVGDYEMNTASAAKSEVTADDEQFVIMGFVTQTDYINRAYDSLKTKCPNKNISGIQSRYSTSLGFFSWTNKIHLQAYCQN